MLTTFVVFNAVVGTVMEVVDVVVMNVFVNVAVVWATNNFVVVVVEVFVVLGDVFDEIVEVVVHLNNDAVLLPLARCCLPVHVVIGGVFVVKVVVAIFVVAVIVFFVNFVVVVFVNVVIVVFVNVVIVVFINVVIVVFVNVVGGCAVER